MNYLPKQDRYSQMTYRKCGESGLKLPAVSLGLWHNFGDNADFDNMCRLCTTAFDNGITHFDIANNYGPKPGSAEKNFGKIINGILKPYRDEIIISTKAGYTMWEGPYGDFGSRKSLISCIDQSLKRLNLDYVDIFYHHRMDPGTPLYETMWALSQIVTSGKALYIGLSNYDYKTMKEASKILNELHCPFIINQNKYSILNRASDENGIFDASIEDKKGVIVFSPLAQGLLSNRYLNGIPSDSRMKTDGRFLNEKSISPELFVKIKELDKIAQKHGCTLAQMALAWVYNREGVTSVLIGASKSEQIVENIKMLDYLSLIEEERDAIENIMKLK